MVSFALGLVVFLGFETSPHCEMLPVVDQLSQLQINARKEQDVPYLGHGQRQRV